MWKRSLLSDRQARARGPWPAGAGQCRAAGILQRHQDAQGPELRRQSDADRQHHPAGRRPAAAGADVELAARTLAVARGEAATARWRKADGRLEQVTGDAALARLLARTRRGAKKPVGAMLSIEGLQDLEGNLDNLEQLHDAGFRMAGLTHFFDNDLAGSMHGLKKGGLTPKGRAAVRRMEAARHDRRRRALQPRLRRRHPRRWRRRPVVSSHGGVQATCKVNRNLTDEEIRGVAKTGGVVGIGYWDAAVCGTSPRDTAARDEARARPRRHRLRRARQRLRRGDHGAVRHQPADPGHPGAARRGLQRRAKSARRWAAMRCG